MQRGSRASAASCDSEVIMSRVSDVADCGRGDYAVQSSRSWQWLGLMGELNQPVIGLQNYHHLQSYMHCMQRSCRSSY